MSSDEDDREEELSKKQRLINAWIAVGPEGKTTDVSDVTDSSRGYASDVRRAITGEGDEDIPFGEIQEAYDGDLVAQYRDELDDEAIQGDWPFMEQLERVRGERAAGGGKPVQQSADTEHAGPDRGQAAAGGRQQPGRQAPAPHQGTAQPPHQQQPQGAGSPAGTGPGAPHHGASPAPAGHRQSGGTPRSGTQQGGAQGQPVQRGSGGAGVAQQPPGQQQPGTGGLDAATAQDLYNRLADLDGTLLTEQRQAQQEISASPPQTQANAIAISKYNLVLEVRQTIHDVATRLQSPQ